jgi:hypothetical protein
MWRQEGTPVRRGNSMSFQASRPFTSAQNSHNLKLEQDGMAMFFKFIYSHNAVSSYGTTDIVQMNIDNDALSNHFYGQDIEEA